MSNVIGPADETDRERWALYLRKVAQSYKGHPRARRVRRNLLLYVWLEVVPPGAMPDGQVASYRIGKRHFSRMTSTTLAQLVALPVPPPPARASDAEGR
jgi:hypothetical protein